jgi:uncharacterized protein YggE
MLHRVLFVLAMGMGVLWLADSASAQIGSNDVVFAAGKIRLQPTPNKLRMQVDIRAYGLTADAALKHLKARRAAATAQLRELNADAASICFSAARAGLPQTVYASPVASAAVSYATPVASTFVPASPAMATTSVAPPAAVYTSSGPSAVPGSSSPAKPRTQLFVAATTLKADWPLQGADADEIVAMAEAIRQRAMAVDLAGSKMTHDPLSPEEQELTEEAEMRFSGPLGPGASTVPPAGAKSQPAFVYVAVLSDKQRKTMLADAYASTKNNATELAEAAGMKLGALANLQGSFSNSCLPGRNFGLEYASSPLASYDERETVAADPDKLEFICAVNASYRLVPEEAKP